MKIIHYSEEDAIIINNEFANDVHGRVVIGSKDEALKFCMRVFELKKGSYTPRHCHNWEHEVFVYSGKGEIFSNGKWIPITSGMVIFVPGGEEHQFKNIEDDMFIFVCLVPSIAPEM